MSYKVQKINIRAYSNHFSVLSIEGNVDAISEYRSAIRELENIPDGYLGLATKTISEGDLTEIELCLATRVPVVPARVYRGKPEPLLDTLIFPTTVCLGAYKCDVSSHACSQVSYSLRPETKKTDGTVYQTPDIICKYCGRDVSPLSSQDYTFCYTDAKCQPEDRRVEFDIDDFVRICRLRMREELKLYGLSSIRIWRKGPSTAVIELTREGIADLLGTCISPLLSSHEDEFSHRHYYHLADIGKLDYTELLLILSDESLRDPMRANQVTYDKYLGVSWATCMNMRCAHRFLTAELSWDKENPAYTDYCRIPIGNSSCPNCRSPYYHSHSACYIKSGGQRGIQKSPYK